MSRSLHPSLSIFHSPERGHLRRFSLRTPALLAFLILLPVLVACPPDQTPSPTRVIPIPTLPSTATPGPTLPSPTPLPFLPPLRFFLPPRAQLVHVEAADTDDDGVEETIVLYRDSDQPEALIRGLIAEPPTPDTPTPAAEEIPLPDVYWLGGMRAAELFQEGWERLRLEDINDDGKSELLLEGHWDTETPAVHVFQWDGKGYPLLLSFRARGELTIEEDERERLRFASLERAFPRSGIITRGSAVWEDGRYEVRHETSWEAEPPPDAPHPEAALLHYYRALASEDAQAARHWWSDALQTQLDAEALADRLMWLPALRLERMELLEESGDNARAAVSLRWTDPFSDEMARSEDEVWEIVRQSDGWRLARLNGTPLEPDWRTFTSDDGLTENFINDLLFDPQGRLWIACGSSGLTLWDGLNWITVQQEEDGLISDTVRAMLLDPLGRYWFATPAGITRYDGLRWLTYTTADGLPSDEVKALAADAEGNVWAGTMLGPARYDGETWQPLPLPDDAPSIQVNAIAVDQEGAVWLGLGGEDGEPAVARYDGEGWQLFGPQDGLVGNWVSALAVAPDGSLWAGMAGRAEAGGGLGVWTGEEWRVQTAFDMLVDVPVYDIGFDADGGIWIATARGAAQGFGDAWLAYTTADGLADNTVNGVLAAPDGVPFDGAHDVVFFGTANGLTRFRDAVPLQVIGGGQ